MVFQTIYATRPAFEVALTEYLLEKCNEDNELSFPKIVFLAKEFARNYKGIKCKMMLKVKPAANIIGKPEIKPYKLEINVVRSTGRFPFLTFHLSGVDYIGNPCSDKEGHQTETILLHLVETDSETAIIKTPTQQQLQSQIDTFNRAYKVGEKVEVYNCNSPETFLDEIKSEATIMGGHTAITWLKEKGWWDLSFVKGPAPPF
ncbi:hypothetical protein GCM10011340_20290 [Roseivirga thermotolerans]|uniref:Uncharacterized protein n=2 Tax=Roseivirga thermotolerans TaxID=1758176 RepID=A0ABQ3IA82_9BACT|nr:hypothetical protein GCM10011340_20290 [Roseivirga thermotolerans]